MTGCSGASLVSNSHNVQIFSFNEAILEECTALPINFFLLLFQSMYLLVFTFDRILLDLYIQIFLQTSMK